jgi:hypothetical protein
MQDCLVRRLPSDADASPADNRGHRCGRYRARGQATPHGNGCSADASFRLLDRATPNLDRAKKVLQRIVADGRRAGAVVDSIPANFRKHVCTRASLDVNELIGEALALERADLLRHRVLVQVEPNNCLLRCKEIGFSCSRFCLI